MPRKRSPIIAGADEIVQEAAKDMVASVQTEHELAAVGVQPQQILLPGESSRKFQEFKRRELPKRIRKLVKEAAPHYAAMPADLTAFEQIGYTEILLERLMANIITQNLDTRLVPPVGCPGKGEGEVALRLFKDLQAQLIKQRNSALLTRGSRQNQMMQQERRDTFEFMKEVRRGLLARSQRPALEHQAPDDQEVQAETRQ